MSNGCQIDFESTLNKYQINFELILLNQKSNQKQFDLAAVAVLYMV